MKANRIQQARGRLEERLNVKTSPEMPKLVFVVLIIILFWCVFLLVRYLGRL